VPQPRGFGFADARRLHRLWRSCAASRSYSLRFHVGGLARPGQASRRA
jgi:hypothetical protein